MKKDYDAWNIYKKSIDNRYIENLNIKVGEIYWCKLGLNIGVEQNGKNKEFSRPVLVLKKFSKELILVAPLTTKIHIGNWYYDLDIFSYPVQVILSQIKPIDRKRLYLSFKYINSKIVNNILKSYIQLILK